MGERSRVKAVGFLVLLACIAAAGLAWLQNLTGERIRENESQRILQSLREVLPPGGYDNAPQLDVLMVSDPALGSADPLPVYRARNGGRPVAAVLTVEAPDGYVDAIRLAVGIDVHGRIIGVRALAHSETPGLGDGIDTHRTDWIHRFDGRSADDPPADRWALRRDGGEFYQLTGATITSRAVVKAVHRALEYFNAHRDELFAATAGSRARLPTTPD